MTHLVFSVLFKLRRDARLDVVNIYFIFEFLPDDHIVKNGGITFDKLLILLSIGIRIVVFNVPLDTL